MGLSSELERGGTLRVGQIGVGYWGPNLLRNLIAVPETQVIAIADRDSNRREFAQQLCPNARVVESAHSVIQRTDIDAVVIATPAKTHFELALAALQEEKHVLVEKPLAMTTSEVRRLKEVAESRDLVLMAGHTFLYNPAVLKLKDVIDGGGLGDIRYIHSQRLNLGRVRSDVDAAWNLAPHDLSIIQYLMNDAEPVTVQRHGMNYIQDGIEDVVFLHLVYPGGVMAHVHVSWLDPLKVRKLTVVGSNRMAVYDDLSEQKLAVYDKGIEPIARLGEGMDYDLGSFEAFHHRSGDIVIPAVESIEPLRAQIDHWVSCIRDGEPCRTGPKHAEMVIRILELASDS